MTAVILVGGLGTRLRALYPNLPKPLIPVAGEPFLVWVIRYLLTQGASDFVIAAGHLGEQVEEFCHSWRFPGATLRCVREPSPLGTGGGIQFAARQAGGSDPFFVVNGDSLTLAPLHDLPSRLNGRRADALVVGAAVTDTSRYGSLDVDAGGWLRGFREKQPGQGWINAGIYLFRRPLLEMFPEQLPLSLEADVFPSLLARGARILVEPVQAPFLDIGTPESIAGAAAFIESHQSLFRLP